MKQYSTRETAEKLGLHLVTLQMYIAAGKIPVPQLLKVGKGKLRIWTDEDIERVREILPKIANGRKTRYKKQSAPAARRGRLSNSQSRQARDRSAKPKSKTGSKSRKKKT